MFISERFKTKVYIDIRNNNTSSILTKQSCLLKILWLKKVIPTKPYSLAMLPLHHTKYSYHAPISAKHLFLYSILSNLSTFTQYMSVSHGHSTMGGIEVVVEKTKRRKIVSHRLGVSTGYGDAHQSVPNNKGRKISWFSIRHPFISIDFMLTIKIDG